ncbi:MAG: hypothetical protein AB8F78_15930 [Saprospiraceae bacterium]
MNRSVLILLLLAVTIVSVHAQRHTSKWSLMVGGQVSYAVPSTPESRVDVATDFLSGYSKAFGLGGVSSLKYRLTSSVAINATLGLDIQRFSYDLIGSPTFGEVDGRTLPGRFLTEYKGLGLTGFTELGTEISLGDSRWSPALVVEAGVRYWLMEHSNTDEAYAAGYQVLEQREDFRHQAHVGAGFGVSPFSSGNRFFVLFQRTFESFEPIHQSLILRQMFKLGASGKAVTCPTF